MKIAQGMKEGDLWKLGVVCLLHLTTIAEADVVSDLCPATCINRSCKDPENNEFYCTYDCPDGYWGRKCANVCLSTCTLCDRELGASGECVGVVSELCPETCINSSCLDPENNLLKCTYGCLDGYWGAKCANECPPTCTSCDREFRVSGQCFECQDGYYLTETNTKCTLKCPSRCSICTSSSQCMACINPYATGANCDQCIDGKYGINCTLDCSSNCHGHNCDPLKGKCSPCKTGYYGEKCDVACSPNCDGQTCYQITGVCSNGCNTCYSGDKCCIQGSHCDTCSSNQECEVCVAGFHGDNCNQACSGNCNNNACNRDRTACLQGCLPGYKGYICSEVTDNEVNPLSIAGIVVGGTVGIAIVVLLALNFMKYRRLKQCCKQPRSDLEQQTTNSVYDDLSMTDSPSNNSGYDSLEPPQSSQMPTSNVDSEESASHDYQNAAILTEMCSSVEVSMI